MLGNHCLEFKELVNVNLKPKYYQILTLILSRGELELASLSLQENRLILPKKILIKKENVAADYQLFIFTVLLKCIKSLNKQNIEPFKHQFIKHSISMCFFHIPKFREQFLSLIRDQDDENAKRDIFFSPKRDKNTSSAILLIYNWQENFYRQLSEKY